MGVRTILDRLHGAIQKGGDYLVPTVLNDADGIVETLESEGPESARALVEQLYADGQISRTLQLSALHVIAASPRVRDFREALCLAGLQEMAVLESGDLSGLASVERHRGVVAYLMGRHGVALDCFTRAWERERSPENLGNVLAALVALGDSAIAVEVYTDVTERFPTEFAAVLGARVRDDDDLRVLRCVTR